MYLIDPEYKNLFGPYFEKYNVIGDEDDTWNAEEYLAVLFSKNYSDFFKDSVPSIGNNKDDVKNKNINQSKSSQDYSGSFWHHSETDQYKQYSEMFEKVKTWMLEDPSLENSYKHCEEFNNKFELDPNILSKGKIDQTMLEKFGKAKCKFDIQYARIKNKVDELEIDRVPSKLQPNPF